MEPGLREAAGASQDLWRQYLQAPEGQDQIELDLARDALRRFVQLLVGHPGAPLRELAGPAEASWFDALGAEAKLTANPGK